jgi:hypothetical protein
MVRLLLAFKADPSVKSDAGTPLDCKREGEREREREKREAKKEQKRREAREEREIVNRSRKRRRRERMSNISPCFLSSSGCAV